LQDWIKGNDLQAFVVSAPANLRYLTGFTGEGIGVLTPRELAVVTDRRYEQEAAAQLQDCRAIFATAKYYRDVAKCLAQSAANRVGFEADNLTYATYQFLQEELTEVELVSTRGVVEEYRAVKDEEEVEKIRRAAAIVDEVLPGFLANLPVNVTEKELSLSLRQQIVTTGADRLSFEPVVAFGANAAAAHATSTDRRLHPGDIVLIDVGAQVDGYCSDITRTIVWGEPSARFSEIYQIVLNAQQAALATIQPGVAGSEVDKAARDVIAEAGYGERFGHSLGHGVGLEVHELPRLGKTADQPLAVGNVVTVEPGIYISEWGGVRIEDMVLITEGGPQVLTSSPKLDLQT